MGVFGSIGNRTITENGIAMTGGAVFFLWARRPGIPLTIRKIRGIIRVQGLARAMIKRR